MADSYAQHFQNAFGSNGKLGYVKAHYDVSGICNKSISQGNGNIINRVRNAVVKLINDQWLLPKVILLILEGDILEEINHFKPGISGAIGRLLEWLANQLHRVITSHKERLPSKSRKYKYPTILWILPIISESGMGPPCT